MAISDMSDNVNKMGSSVESVQNAYNGFAKGNFTMLDNLKLGYGGTKEEMQRLLNKAEEISGYKYDISSYADIVEAIHVVQNEMGITGTTAKEADATIQGSLSATKAAWENVITAMAGGNIDLQDSIDALVESGINTINNIWPVISNALNGVAELVKRVAPIIAENLPGMIEEVLPKLLDAAITLLGGVAQALPGLFKVVLDAIGVLFRNIKTYIDLRNPALGRKINEVATFFSNAWDAVLKFWDETLQPALQELWKWVCNKLMPALRNAWDSLSTKVETVVEAIKKFWEKTLQPALKEMWTWICNTMMPAIKNAWGSFSTKVETVVKAIKAFWTDTLKPALQDLWTWITNDFVPAVTKAWGKISTKVETVVNNIKDFWINTLHPTLKELWTWITNDFVPAVTKAWGKISTKVETVVNAISKFWTETLQPTLKELWTWITNDFVPAVTKAWGKISTKVENVFNAISGFWTSTLQPVVSEIWSFIVDEAVPAITGAWESISSTVETVFTAVKTWWDESGSSIFNTISSAISGVYDTLQRVLNDMILFITSVFKGDWNTAWTAVRDLFGTIFEGLWNLMKKPINGVIKGLNWAISAVEHAINRIIRGINSKLHIHIPEKSFTIMGKKITAWTGLDWSPGLSGVTFSRLQYLAKGGVLQEGQQAIVGENAPEYLTVRGGRAVVTPIKGVDRSGTTIVNFTINAAPGMDAYQVAQEVQRIMVREQKQRTAAFA